jgi:hypothetical protein
MKFVKVWPSNIINTKGHWAIGTVWKMVASSGKGSYNVTMSDKGFSCSCPAFKKCKHIRMVEEGFCYE